MREYITVLLDKQCVEWRVLSGTRYRLLRPAKDRILRSPNLPGLWLDTQALFPLDRERLFDTIDRVEDLTILMFSVARRLRQKCVCPSGQGCPSSLAVKLHAFQAEVAMPLLYIVFTLIVVGILLHLINRYVPMAGSIRSILNCVVVIAVCVWVLKAVGLWSQIINYRIPH